MTLGKIARAYHRECWEPAEPRAATIHTAQLTLHIGCISQPRGPADSEVTTADCNRARTHTRIPRVRSPIRLYPESLYGSSFLGGCHYEARHQASSRLDMILVVNFAWR